MDLDNDTAQRLILAATPLFAKKGFAAVSIRELAEAAGVNVAAISYHFGGKESLYQAVLEEQFAPISNILEQLGQALHLPPAERLALYAENIADVHRQRPYFVQFMHCEMANPTCCFDSVFKRYISEIFRFLNTALQEGIAAGQFRADLDIGLAVLSFVGIMNFFFLGRPMAKNFLSLSDHSDEDYTRQSFSIFLEGLRRKSHE